MELLANWLVQGTAVALALFGVLRGLRRASARGRYLACWAALVLIAGLPAMSFVSAGVVTTSDASLAPVVVPERVWLSSRVVGVAWTGWMTVQVVRLIRAVLALRRAKASALPFPDHVQSRLPHWTRVRHEGRHSTLVRSDAVSSAAVLGGRSPLIAVSPGAVAQLDDEELDRVLLHEWAHVQRRDDLALLLQLAFRVVIGWHPAVWWIEQRLHLEREVACDEIAVAVAGSPKSYASCLVKVAGLRHTLSALVAPGIRPGRELRHRVVRVVMSRDLLSPSRSRAATIAVVVVLCVVGIAVSHATIVRAESRRLALPAISVATVGLTAPHAIGSIATDVESSRIPAAAARSTSAVLPARARVREVVAQEQLVRESGRQAVSEETTAADTTLDELLNAASVAPPASADQVEVNLEDKSAPAVSPWARTADLGIAVGQRSKAAGIGTANAFRRFATRVANSF